MDGSSAISVFARNHIIQSKDMGSRYVHDVCVCHNIDSADIDRYDAPSFCKGFIDCILS